MYYKILNLEVVLIHIALYSNWFSC